jgi:hypothetical protein
MNVNVETKNIKKQNQKKNICMITPTEQDIIAGNKTIFESPFHGTDYDPGDMPDSFYLKNLRYHNHYDMSLSVVDAVREGSMYTDISLNIKASPDGIVRCELSSEKSMNKWVGEHTQPWLAVWFAVVEFCKWYNSIILKK